MFLLAILTPFLMTVVLLVPLYGFLLGACYIVYLSNAAAAQALLTHWLDVFYIIDVYTQLTSYWLAHQSAVSFVHYTLPVVALPLFGLLFSLWLTYKVAKGMLHLFRLGTVQH